ncbi:MAG: zinc dependent phospholipase C family protein [Cytophagales bacterium]
MRFFLRFGFSFLCLISVNTFSWGFFAHQHINRYAVFCLPPEMIPFFKKHIVYLTENAVNPDRRRYAVEGEAENHYIDIDIYGDSAVYKMPRKWEDAVAKYSEDTLRAYGIVPWHIVKVKKDLTWAFKNLDANRILRIAADLGHYIGDSNVPLHTTHNYNGQYTNQYGIHGFWESRLPELFSEKYDFFVGRAVYLKDPQQAAWEGVMQAHLALDSVLKFEKILTDRFGEDKKYGFETRNNLTVRVYSRDFSKAYHDMLNGQVERQMTRAVHQTASFWYTCWVDAGKPDLSLLLDFKFDEEELKKEREKWKKETIKARPHDAAMLENDCHFFHNNCCGGDRMWKKMLTINPMLRELYDEHDNNHSH